jgi:hypothetical protein
MPTILDVDLDRDQIGAVDGHEEGEEPRPIQALDQLGGLLLCPSSRQAGQKVQDLGRLRKTTSSGGHGSGRLEIERKHCCGRFPLHAMDQQDVDELSKPSIGVKEPGDA